MLNLIKSNILSEGIFGKIQELEKFETPLMESYPIIARETELNTWYLAFKELLWFLIKSNHRLLMPNIAKEIPSFKSSTKDQSRPSFNVYYLLIFFTKCLAFSYSSLTTSLRKVAVNGLLLLPSSCYHDLP